MGNNQSDSDRRTYDTPTSMNRDDASADTRDRGEHHHKGYRHHKRDDDDDNDVNRSGSYGGRSDPSEDDNDRNKQQQSSGGSFLTDNPIARGIGLTSSLFKGKDNADDEREQQQQPRGDTSRSYSGSAASRDDNRGADDSYGSHRSGYATGGGDPVGGWYSGGSSRDRSYTGGASYGQGRDDSSSGSSGAQGYGNSKTSSMAPRSGYADDESNPSGYRSADTYGRSGGARDDRY